jgi:5-methylcytosine-specific restriction endonuclease McrA
MDIRRKSRPKPWMAKKKGRNWRAKGSSSSGSFGGTDNTFYRSEQWKATSKAVLDRDGVCQWCLYTAKVTPATEADHIIPVNRCEEEGVNPYDQTNIVGSCRSCNSRRASYEAKGTHLNTFDDWVKFLRRKLLEKRHGI